MDTDETCIGSKRLIEENLIRMYLGENNVYRLRESKNFPIKDDSHAIKLCQNWTIIFSMNNHDNMNHETLWRISNECVALARCNLNLALAYALRAKFLWHIEKYEASAEDCERAWKLLSKNDKKREFETAEFLLRNFVLCNIRLKRFMTKDERNDILKRYNKLGFSTKKQKKLLLNNFITYLQWIGRYDFNDDEKTRKRNVKKKNYPDFDRNDKVPWASRSLEFQMYETGGLYVVATRDIEPGEILAVNEKTFFHVEIDRSFHDCCYCRTLSWNPIPCDNCSFSMYCSENCKTKHWTDYHRWECNVIPVDIPERKKTTFCFFLELVRQAGGYDKFIDYVYEEKRSKGLPNLNFDQKNILSFYANENLKKESIYNEELIENSIILAYYLATKTNFLGKTYDENCEIIMKNEIIALAAALVRCDLIYDENYFYLTYYYPDQGPDFTGGFSLYPLVNYFQPSCVPNASYFTSADHKLVIFAKNTIKKGSQITISYLTSKTYLDSGSLFERNKQLELISAKCSCLACKNNWQKYDLKTVRMLLLHEKDFIFLLQMVKEEYQPLLDDLKQRNALPFSYIEKIIQVMKIFSELSLENTLEYEIFSKYLLMAYIANYGNLREFMPNDCPLPKQFSFGDRIIVF